MDSDRQTRSGSGRDTAADSTQYRPLLPAGEEGTSASVRRHSDAYYASQKSIRLSPRASRGGLAAKMAVPIVASLLVGLLLFSLVVRTRVSALQLEDLKSDAANGAFTTGLLGRFVIGHRDRFLRAHPEYLARAEWLTGEHWLVKHGFVGEKEWVEATGFNLNEYAPTSILDGAAERLILSNFDQWLATPLAVTEMVAVFLLNENGTVLAASADRSFRFDPLALKALPLPAHYVEMDGFRIHVDRVDGVEPEPLVRGVARIMSPDEPGRVIGSSITVFRTQRHAEEQHSFLILLLWLAVLLAGLMALACWWTARRVTAPIRRLAADMQAMAEGDYARRSGLVNTDEVGLLAQAFNSMAERLRVARANERETSRLESDLAVAREIQNNLLPLQTPRVRGLDIHTSYRPAREIGGDYFDFLPVDAQHMGIVVADASGKSIPAALVMSTTRAILRFVAPGNTSAAETLTRVNAILSVDIPKGMFVTAYYVVYDPLQGSMICSSAGHTPLLVARADGTVEILNPGGISLGFDSGPIFQRSIREQRVKLERGDRALLYTDGVVECVNPANEEYSDRRLREFLRRNRDLSSHDFVGALLADLDRHRGAADMRDDTTIVTFKVL